MMAIILEFTYTELNRLNKGELIETLLRLKDKLHQFEDRRVDTKYVAQFLNRSEAWVRCARFSPKNGIEKRLHDIGIKCGDKKSSRVEYKLSELKDLRENMHELAEVKLD